MIALIGCRLPWPGQDVEVDSPPAPELRTHYDRALASYYKGDYATAVEQFATLREKGSGGRLSRMALYGQACAQLMAADNPLAYREALNLWETWLSSAPRQTDYEDPAMIAPLVENKMLFSNLPPAKDDAETRREEKEILQWVLIKTRRELDDMRTKLNAAEKTAGQQAAKISSLEKEIARLKEQIHALETIDQKIQKKKSAIPSAD